MKGFILYPTYRIKNNKAYIVLIGKLENNQTFATLTPFQPYFYIKKSDLKLAKSLEDFKYEETKFKTFDNKPVVKIILDLPKEVPELRNIFESEGIRCYEADIRFAYRFLIDNNIQSCIEIEGDYDSSEYIDQIYQKPNIKPASFIPKLKVLAIDIETDNKSSQIYSISLYSSDIKEVLMVSDKKLKNAASYPTEEEMLYAFYDKIKSSDPDILTGWNFIDFDLKIIRKRFKKYNIPFTLGRDNTVCKLRLENDFFRTSQADFPGRIVLDGIDLLKSSFIKLNSYKLDDAAEAILGSKKLIQFKDKQKEINELYNKDKEKLALYNLKDSELVYKILKKTGVIDLTIQRSLLTGLPLDRVNASIASLDQLYLKETKKLNLVAPSSFYNIKESSITGGYVKESEPGLYDYILVLDFKSLYPSIIRTFNIDPASYKYNCSKDDIKAPNGACFKNTDGILPKIIERLWKERDQAKKSNNQLSSLAIKILMNSFFGVLANPSCRFFSLDIANAITHFGQFIIKLSAKEIEKLGYKVIYSDTDSLFVISKASCLKDATKIGKFLEQEINSFYKDYVKKKYKRTSFLELEFEKCYVKLLLPKIRGKETGAKKRYAGLIIKDNKEEIQVTGMETVRSDWTDLAKEFQKELLDLIFHDKDPAPYIQKCVKDLFSGKLDKKLIYRKSLRKELKDYTKTTPPHVKAARKLSSLSSNVIEYVITIDGPEPVQEQKNKIDYEHYLNKQLKPIAESILVFFNKTFDDIIKGNTQTSLSSFS
ncbi:DNA polymerase II [Candidatus Woesearchaeota archaeon]|nr:MAG: DNA polymerase II [Candidatus Woesearchaeota archaeon]